MSVRVMTVGVMSVGEITVGIMTVGVMTVGVMRRPLFNDIYKYIFICFNNMRQATCLKDEVLKFQ
jgi:hypothetical protein